MNASRCKPRLAPAALILLALPAALVTFGGNDLIDTSAAAHGGGEVKTRTQGRAATAEPDEAGRARVMEAYGRLPISFEANQGQTAAQVKFLSRGPGYSLFLTPSEAVLSLNRPAARGIGKVSPAAPSAGARREVLRMKLLGADPSTRMTALGELPGRSNYFIGDEQEQ